MLELKNVSKVYKTKSGDVGALNGVSLTFPETGLVFITGKSGCGKTTMLNVIGGLDGIDEGQICLYGKSFDSFTQTDYDNYRNTFIGFIFQEYNLLSEFSVEKNIEIAMELQGRPTDKEELDKLLKEMDIMDLKDRKPSELSGGQRQRVAIARALVKNPSIIMADEPTGALDSKTGIQVIEILKKLSKSKLVIVVSHDEEFAKKYADRIVHLVDGVVDSDITFTEKESDSNVSQGEETVLVKAGSTLTADEKDLLALAVKQSKKIELIDNLSSRAVEPTDTSKIKKTQKEVQLQRSQMKLKSSLALGVKSLSVKPVRLIFTILLSVIAFAVFGLFDTVANFDRSRVMNSVMRNSTSTVSLYGEYYETDEEIDKYEVKLSDKKLKEISNETGLYVKGIYDFQKNEHGNAISFSQIIELAGYSFTYGKEYYRDWLYGYIEFSEDELSSNRKTIEPFGYTVVEGRYPKIERFTNSSGMEEIKPESLQEVAISTYTAESILARLNGNPINGKEINTISDLLDVSITVSGMPWTIVGIINCGEFSDKYDVLKTSTKSTELTRSLKEDFEIQLFSGAHTCLFVADGLQEELNRQSINPTIYYAGKANWKVVHEGKSADNYVSAETYVYSYDDCSDNNVIMFDKDRSASEKLKSNEVLIHASNLEFLFWDEIISAESKNQSVAQDIIGDLVMGNCSPQTKKNKLQEFFSCLNLSTTDKSIKTISVTKTLLSKEKTVTKNLVVVGIYVDFDSAKPANEYRFMFGKQQFEDFEIYSEQGEFSRFITSPSENRKGTKILSNYMINEDGFSLVWYENSALEMVKENETSIRQGADLLLYVALVLALFAVFMLFNYITTSISNKMTTIGVLRGLGSGKRDILRIFLGESLIIALINGVIASIVTVIGCVLVNSYIMNVMLIAIPFAIFGVRQVLMMFGLSVLTAVLSSIAPIVKVAKKKPVELIRNL